MCWKYVSMPAIRHSCYVRLPLQVSSRLRPDLAMNEEITTVPDEPSEEAASSGRRRQLIVAGLVGLAGFAGVIAWFAVGPTGSSDKPHAIPIKRIGLSASGLRTLAGIVPQPIYWAGPRADYLYELRRTSNGNVYVRYLPPGVDVGAPGNDLLVIATYASSGALSALEQSADGQGIRISGGGLAVVNAKTRRSVYVALPHVDYEAEVFDASLDRALALVKAGQIRPVKTR
jgi:hypothetical protein